MEVARGEVWWADLPDPVASAPGGTHPVVVVQADTFNRARLSTVICAILTSNLGLADMPGNVTIGPRETGLRQPSVVNVTQILTADRSFLRARAGRLRPETMERIDDGLKLVLGLR